MILLAESSQQQLAAVLPVLYREIMTQNEAALEEGLDEEDRLIIRQTRPKVIIADHHEAAMKLYQNYKHETLLKGSKSEKERSFLFFS